MLWEIQGYICTLTWRSGDPKSLKVFDKQCKSACMYFVNIILIWFTQTIFDDLFILMFYWKKNVLNCDSYMEEIFIFFLHNVHAHIIFKLRFYAPFKKWGMLFSPVNQALVCRPCVVHSISLDSFFRELLNLVQWFSLGSKCFSFNCQTSRSNCWSFYKY